MLRHEDHGRAARLRAPKPLRLPNPLTDTDTLTLPGPLTPPAPLDRRAPRREGRAVQPPIAPPATITPPPSPARTTTALPPSPAIAPPAKPAARVVAPRAPLVRPARRRAPMVFPKTLLAAAAAVALIVAVLDDNAEPDPVGPEGTMEATSILADDMPIPYGTVPVEPVRIVIDLSSYALPTRERRTLARWIAQTQHPRTRVRVVRDGRATAPLDEHGLRATPAFTRPARAARRWLVRGSHAGVQGGWEVVGAWSASSRGPAGPRMRTGFVTIRTDDVAVRRRIAARIAREIMVSARQATR